jgi:ABC-2 type transport system permease protein
MESDVLRISWRLQRTGLVGMGLFGVFYGLIQSTAYGTAAGSTEASRVAFGHQMEQLGPTLSYFLPLPVRVDTIQGYLQWRVYGALPMLFGFWALMSASGATRGDEERGLLEQWLTRGVGRSRYLVTRLLMFIVVAVITIALTSVAIYLSALKSAPSLEVGPFLELALALLAVTLVGYAFTLVVAQTVSTRASAATLAGGLLLITFSLNGFSRTVDSLVPWARVLSPFYQYDRSNPLAPGGAFDAVSTAGLLVAALVLAVVAILLFSLRDIGSPLLHPPVRQVKSTTVPSPNPLLRVPVLAAVYQQRATLAAWSVGTAVLAVFMASIAPQMNQLVNGPGAFRAYLTVVGHGDPLVAITGYFWFGIFEALLSVFAITQVARWSADDNEGRLEMELTAPVSRWRVVLERCLGLLVAVSVVVAISSVAFYLSARASNIHLSAGDLTVASLVTVPFGLSFGAVGAVLASRVPRATIAILATLAFGSYLINEAGPLLQWPDWVQKLSIFSLIGNPLTDGVYWTGLWGLLAITVVGFGLAALVMQRREVGS